MARGGTPRSMRKVGAKSASIQWVMRPIIGEVPYCSAVGALQYSDAPHADKGPDRRGACIALEAMFLASAPPRD